MPRSKDLNAIDMHVGARVRMRRLMLDMTQEKLGDALGLTFQQIQKYEKGANRIGAGRLQQLSVILQVPVAFFFDGMRPATAVLTTGSPSDALPTSELDKFLTSSRGSCLDQGLHADQERRDPPPHCGPGGRDRESARPALIICRRALLPDL